MTISVTSVTNPKKERRGKINIFIILYLLVIYYWVCEGLVSVSQLEAERNDKVKGNLSPL